MSSQQQVGLRTLSRQQWEREQREAEAALRDRLAEQHRNEVATMHLIHKAAQR